MKYGVLFVFLLSCLITSLLSLWIGLKSKDFVLLAISLLLIIASILIFIEIRNIKNDPF